MRNGFFALSALLLCAVQATAAPKPPAPSLGPKATVIRNTNLYVGPDTTSARLAEVSPGREMVIGERNGPWVRVYVDTDEQISKSQDAPVFGHDAAAVPIAGWMQAPGVVSVRYPQGNGFFLEQPPARERRRQPAARSPGIRPGSAPALPAGG